MIAFLGRLATIEYLWFVCYYSNENNVAWTGVNIRYDNMLAPCWLPRSSALLGGAGAAQQRGNVSKGFVDKLL